MESAKPQCLIFQTYLQLVRNAVGTKMFRNLYVEQNGQAADVMVDGAYSCAFFVSSVLTLFDQNTGIHGTIVSTLADLKRHGWQEVAEMQPGDIIVWEGMEFEGQLHEHIGFYVGDGYAVSTSYKTKTVVEHQAGDRRIVKILRQPKWPA